MKPRKTNIPAVAVRQGGLKYKLIYGEMVEFIREYPGQWLLFHRFC